MHHLTIDIGNTATKVAIHKTATSSVATEIPNEGQAQRANHRPHQHNPIATHHIQGHHLADLTAFIAQWDIAACIISSTVTFTPVMLQHVHSWNIHPTIVLDNRTPLPIYNHYSTPQTLGADRLAAVVGAYYEAPLLTGEHAPALVIDLGTAITYDFITSDGHYLGGNISPGMDMRFRALHTFTDRLPLVDPHGEHPSIGHSTDTAIRCGILDGIRYEIEGTIRQFLVKYPQLLIFLTGGDAIDFEETPKNRIFADKFLVAKGLNYILQYIKDNTETDFQSL